MGGVTPQERKEKGIRGEKEDNIILSINLSHEPYFIIIL